MSRTVRPVVAVVLALVVVAAWGLPALAQAASDAVAADPIGLPWWKAAILGLVEGLSEYLPISSTGHLLVTNSILGLDDTEAAEKAIDTYAICIQAGAILAVLFLYWGRVRQMLDGLLGRSDEGRRVLLAVLSAFVPTAIIGLALADTVKDRLFGIVPIGIAWLLGGLVILWLVRSSWFDRAGHALADISTRQAVIVGVAQAIALWPGVSRSMVTIVVAVAVGLSLTAAVEFSFLLGLVTLSAATVLEGASGGADLVDTFGLATPLLGLLVAFVSAMAAVRWMVAWLEQRGFGVFGWYRIVIGVAALGSAAAGVL